MPTLHRAAADHSTGSNGAVYCHPTTCSRPEAEDWRRAGQDIAVRGDDPDENERVAFEIEAAVANVHGTLRHDPHHRAGPLALPHYQAKVPPPRGHTFFENGTRKAVLTP